MLQERLQAERHLTPHYNLVETLGPPHARIFHVEVVFDDERVRGEGGTIKSAETDAARRALELLGAPSQNEEQSEERSEEPRAGD
jgi:ribonuclease-3